MQLHDLFPAMIVLVMAMLLRPLAASGTATAVRPSICASAGWYPADPDTLASTVDDLLAGECPARLDGAPLAVIAPHAGYRYSAPVAAAAYRCVRGRGYTRVIALAFSHRYAGAYDGVHVPAALAAYETPLGRVPLDRDVIDALRRSRVFVSPEGVDRDEHSLELQLPLLQRALKEFKLVPLLVGRMTSQEYAQAAAAILPFLDERTLLVASSDFTHYGPHYGYTPFRDDVANRLRTLAEQAAAPILACDFDGFADHVDRTRDTICGRGPILLLLRILSMGGGAVGVRAAFDTSGRMTGDFENSVTYQSFVFARRRGTLGAEAQEAALTLARRTIEAVLRQEPVPDPPPETLPETLRKDGACFVTLQNHGRLRGCIGNMVAQGPLYKAIIHNAISAATEDYRFADNPVTSEELKDIDLEISYLTPMKRVQSVQEIVVGRHGLYISVGPQRGVLLPQVAYERGWTREEFLGQTCRKAGLPPDAWKQPGAEIQSFEAEVFGEHKGATPPAK